METGVRMETVQLDRLKSDFENALERWRNSIERMQRVLAATSHSARSEDQWREADFEQEDAQKAVKETREAYENAVRNTNFGF